MFINDGSNAKYFHLRRAKKGEDSDVCFARIKWIIGRDIGWNKNEIEGRMNQRMNNGIQWMNKKMDGIEWSGWTVW